MLPMTINRGQQVTTNIPRDTASIRWILKIKTPSVASAFIWTRPKILSYYCPPVEQIPFLCFKTYFCQCECVVLRNSVCFWTNIWLFLSIELVYLIRIIERPKSVLVPLLCSLEPAEEKWNSVKILSWKVVAHKLVCHCGLITDCNVSAGPSSVAWEHHLPFCNVLYIISLSSPFLPSQCLLVKKIAGKLGT